MYPKKKKGLTPDITKGLPGVKSSDMAIKPGKGLADALIKNVIGRTSAGRNSKRPF